MGAAPYCRCLGESDGVPIKSTGCERPGVFLIEEGVPAAHLTAESFWLPLAVGRKCLRLQRDTYSAKFLLSVHCTEWYYHKRVSTIYGPVGENPWPVQENAGMAGSSFG